MKKIKFYTFFIILLTIPICSVFAMPKTYDSTIPIPSAHDRMNYKYDYFIGYEFLTNDTSHTTTYTSNMELKTNNKIKSIDDIGRIAEQIKKEKGADTVVILSFSQFNN